jgi:hypothetical protein
VSNARAGAIDRAFATLKSRPLALWAALVLLPTLLLLFLRGDLLLAPRTVLEGMVNAKSLRADSESYGAMLFRLSGQPYGFAGLIEMVQAPTPHPKSNYAAVQEGVPAKVTVLERDLKAAGSAPQAAVPVLLIEQNGSYVFISGAQFQAWILVPAALALAVFGLLGVVGWPPRLSARLPAPVQTALRGFERKAQGIAQFLHPTRATDPPDRQVRHGAYVAMARLWIIFTIIFLAALLAVIVMME